jgi:hypothetical protein
MLLLLTIIAGFFGEVYVPSHIIVAGDAAATAANLAGQRDLLRLGFASYLVEAVCDVALSWIFYVLLRPVHRDVALLAAFFGLVSTSLYGVAEVFYFALPLSLTGGAGYLKAFTSDQANALSMLSLRLYGLIGGMFMVFYGIATAIRGYLIVRSGFLPKTLGVLLCIAGAGFIVRNTVLVLAPAYASDLLLFPMFIATLSLMVWLFVKGIDQAAWSARVESADGFIGSRPGPFPLAPESGG